MACSCMLVNGKAATSAFCIRRETGPKPLLPSDALSWLCPQGPTATSRGYIAQARYSAEPLADLKTARWRCSTSGMANWLLSTVFGVRSDCSQHQSLMLVRQVMRQAEEATRQTRLLWTRASLPSLVSRGRHKGAFAHRARFAMQAALCRPRPPVAIAQLVFRFPRWSQACEGEMDEGYPPR
jgi:hypothetical protein